eukprot:NODE_1167_length_1542_cov_43.536504_g810_i1.p1 GENE.NODE_1167_length_1542_cov_43.536504_g810_i1~~NODE_1167_length_1542_cov_43.536504_g810_i1.p1  ORF type:complete len:456 (-),score=45.97 NODE_1167_length_1542_cov_43.536504_g810_i1:174-1463(-)
MILASYLVFDKGSQMPWKDLMGLLVWALGGPEFSVQGSSLPVFPGTAAKAFRKSILATKGKASPALVSQFLRRARRVATDARSRILGIKNAPLYYGQRSRQAGDPIKYLAFREQILPETTLRALSMAFGGRPAEYEHLRDPVSTEVRQNLRGDELAPFWVNPNSGTLSLIKPSGFLQRDLSKPAEGWMALKGRWEEAEVSKGKLTVTPSAEEEVDPEDLEPLAAHLAAEAPDSVIFKVPASYNSVVQVEYEPAVDYTGLQRTGLFLSACLSLTFWFFSVVYMQSLGVFGQGLCRKLPPCRQESTFSCRGASCCRGRFCEGSPSFGGGKVSGSCSGRCRSRSVKGGESSRRGSCLCRSKSGRRGCGRGRPGKTSSVGTVLWCVEFCMTLTSADAGRTGGHGESRCQDGSRGGDRGGRRGPGSICPRGRSS